MATGPFMPFSLGMTVMSRSSDERIASALLEIDRVLQSGRPIAEAMAEIGIAVAHIQDLSRENTRLRRIVADRDLEIEMLRELSRGTY